MSEAKVTAKTVYEDVSMDDGEVVKFPGKRQLLKSSSFEADGTIVTRFDFRNGEVRTFRLEAGAELLARFAAHGIEQKIGDEVAGLDDIEDKILAIDGIMERLQAGDWSATRESSGLAGTSVLARALIQVTGKTPAQVKEFLKGKSNAEKLALRQNAKIAPVVQELEAKKKRKEKEAVDTDGMLEELDA
jgi:hypothetical protein